MVVADYRLDPQRARQRDLLHGGDAAVGGYQQAGAALGQSPDRLGAQPIPLGAVGQMPIAVGAKLAQGPHEHGGGADAVDVVVAVDRYPRAGRARSTITRAASSRPGK